MFKGSTESCFNVALPKLVEIDAALLPDELMFEVPGVPQGMMQKAGW